MSRLILFLAHLAAFAQAFEWAGAMHLADGRWFTLTFYKNMGAYADNTIQIVLISATEADEPNGVQLAENAAARANLTGNCPDTFQGATVKPGQQSNTDGCYTLMVDDTSWFTTFHVDNLNASDHIVLFVQHVPKEFAAPDGSGLLRSDAGVEIPAELWPGLVPGNTGAAARSKPWGNAIGAAIAVNLITLIGVIFLIPCLAKAARTYPEMVETIMSSFASGALLSCALCLLVLEASHIIEEGLVESGRAAEENDVTWRWAASILGGFISPFAIDLLVTLATGVNQGHSHGPPRISDIPLGDMSSTPQQPPELPSSSSKDEMLDKSTQASKARIVGGVLLGDFMHNLCDGVFIGTAFLNCGPSFGWSVCGSSIGHEIAQELSDYLVLTSAVQGGLKPVKALLYNFLSGMGVLLGVIIVIGADTVSTESVGVILAFGGGVYIHVGAAECLPRVYALSKTWETRTSSLMAFLVGAIAIGLVLLNHGHCEGGEGGGHAHSH